MKKRIFLIIFSFLLLAGLSGCQKEEAQITPEAAKTEIESGEEKGLAEEKSFTLEELAQFNGQDGQPAYVAVDGVVYDVSAVFTQGKHYQHLAGQALTDEFYSAHAKISLEEYPVMGGLVK